MRLICPNCNAEYEVEADLIPIEGRDVQCSNCDNTWFQPGAKETPPEPAPAMDAPSETPEDPEPSQRPSIDPEALSIIHEEVERETQARAAETGNLETQTDLGLNDAQDDEKLFSDLSDMVSENSEALEDFEDEDVSPLAAAPTKGEQAQKGGIFPDIDEINSTLEAASGDETEIVDEEAVAAHKSGFRTGFLLIIFVVVVLFLLYVLAPQIVESVPSLAGVMESYVASVNSARIWLDGIAQGLVQQMTGETGEGS